MNARQLLVLDICELKNEFSLELGKRRISQNPGDFSHRRGDNSVPLYACTGAANIFAVLGLDFGDLKCKQKWASRINSFQEPDGSFLSPSGVEHAAITAISALNILGFPPRLPVKNLAPTYSKNLLGWLKGLNWQGTHKDFCCGVAPVLASGIYDSNWIPTLRNYVDGMITPEKPLEIWCSSGDEPYRVISCIYHITSGYDAASLAYPHPELLWQRICDLNYEKIRDGVTRTICTDFDFIHMLHRLTLQLPARFEKFLSICRDLFIKRYEEWRHKKESLFEQNSCHDLFCYLIGWAVLQRVLPDQFVGPVLYDTQNAPWLCRLPSVDYIEP